MKITKFQYLNDMTHLNITMPIDWSFDKIQQHKPIYIYENTLAIF
jgi:hypothetical protein